MDSYIGVLGEEASKKPKWPLRINSEADLLTVMETIDLTLGEEIKMPIRFYVACMAIADRYDIPVSMCPPRNSAMSDTLNAIDISIRVLSWLEDKYC